MLLAQLQKTRDRRSRDDVYDGSALVFLSLWTDVRRCGYGVHPVSDHVTYSTRDHTWSYAAETSHALFSGILRDDVIVDGEIHTYVTL